MLDVLDKMLDEDFADTFKPATEEEVEKRREIRIAQYKKESAEWLKVKGKSIDIFISKLTNMRMKRNNLRVTVKAFLQNIPESVEEFVEESDTRFFYKLHNYFSQDISDIRLIDTLNRIKDLAK